MPKDLTDGKSNIGSGNGLVPSGNTPLPEPVLPRYAMPYGVTRPNELIMNMKDMVTINSLWPGGLAKMDHF